MVIGSKIIKLNTVGSTNNYAIDLVRNSLQAEGTVLWATEQTQGRGQRDNEWKSDAGKNLTFSIVLYPAFLSADRQFLITKVVSLGIHDFLKDIVAGVTIKWTNDIYINDKKLAGILIENAIIGKELLHSVVGIGMNINQETFSDALPNAISLKTASGKAYDLEFCFINVCKKIDARYVQLKNKEYDSLHKDYLDAMYRYGKFYMYESKGVRFSAKINGITPFGQLILETEKNEVRVYDYGDVSMLPTSH